RAGEDLQQARIFRREARGARRLCQACHGGGEVSRFTEQDAARLAILAVRPRNGQTEEEAQQNAPLLGEEAALLEALRAAERAHDEAMREARSDAEWLEDLKSSRERHRVFFKYIDAALAEWRNMDGETRLGLAWHAHSTGSNGGD